MHLALWTLLAAAAYALTTQAPTIDRLILGASLAFFVGVHFVFAVKIHTGQILEQDLSIVYRHHAEFILREGTTIPSADASLEALATSREERSAMPVKLKAFFKSYFWWLGSELSTTVLIAAAVYFLAVSAVPRASADSVSDLKRELAQVTHRLDAAEAKLDRPQQTQFPTPALPGDAKTPK